jgi:predicted tellurium resistance membrane protein TerC/predicted transcriptional regulator
MEWLADPTAWIGLLTLVALEIVLGIDNLIFLAILAEKLPAEQRDRARIIGLTLALAMRLGLLAGISWVMAMTAPVLRFWVVSLSWRDIILIAGGIFLLIKATTEIHERVEAPGAQPEAAGGRAAFSAIVAQIVVLDAVFSLDSIITAVGMVDNVAIMMTAVVIAVGMMLVASKPLTRFVTAHPTLIMLCLGFLLMIGLVLVVDGFGLHIPKGYVYAAIGFSLLIEILNQLAARNRPRLPSRKRIAEAVLRMLGGVPLQTERRMVEEVLSLAERKVTAIMTSRQDVVWIDAREAVPQVLSRLRATPHREFPVGDGSLDHVLGIVRKEDVLAQCVDGGPIDLAQATRKCLTVREAASVLEVLALFKREPAEMAFVVDAAGGFKGVVTREDLLEAIAGDLPDARAPLAQRA